MQLAIRRGFAFVLLIALWLTLTAAQNQQPAGKPIGSISTHGDLIVLTLDEGALGHANLFDLAKHTLRFTPELGRLSRGERRIQLGPVVWRRAACANPDAGDAA